MNQPATAWRSYHGWNPRNERMAELWVRDIVAHLRGQPWLDRDRAVLDFGCGYFDAGLALADRAGRVDGVDIEPYALGVARSRTAGTASRIYGGNDELPRGTYDLIFANSVFQYLDGDDGIVDTLRLFRTLLRPGGRGEVLVADLIPRRYSAVRDALRSFWVSARHGVLLPMMSYLAKAALNRNGSHLHQLDPGRMAELAAAAGFRCELLRRNLTPSLQRYTCRLTAL